VTGSIRKKYLQDELLILLFDWYSHS